VPRSAGTRTFVCGDGRRLLCNATSTPRFQRWFSQATGADAPSPESFATGSALEWETRINTVGAPSTFVRTADEWLHNDHARARGTIVELHDPELGPTSMPGVHVHTSEPGENALQPRHLPDADRAAVLARLADGEDGWSTPRQPPTPTTAGVPEAALSGMRVVDLTQVVAGPCTGRILAEYGADVIKINTAHPDSLTSALSLSGRPTDPGNQQHEHLNRGKQTLLLDLHASESTEIIDALFDSADVVMQNFASGMAERLGVGYADVRTRKPNIVYFSLSAYGYGGAMGAYRGFEGNAQAAVGLMDRFGGDGPPLGQPYLLDDYGTGIRGAFAIGLGMYHRLRTGRGQHIDISLVETATYHSAPFLLEYRGSTHDEPRGIKALGSGPLHRLYRAADGWFFLGTDDVRRLGGIDDLTESALEEGLAKRPIAYWLPRLQAAGVGAQPLTRIEELMQTAWVRDHGLSVTQGNMTMPGIAVRMSRTPLRLGAAVRPPGDDAPAILASIGMAPRLDALMQAGAITMTHAPASPSLA
jgi:crotonobetainyl-CoA:carnitine CoA-transferase CaiB-like acyl-CoA transferase